MKATVIGMVKAAELLGFPYKNATTPEGKKVRERFLTLLAAQGIQALNYNGTFVVDEAAVKKYAAELEKKRKTEVKKPEPVPVIVRSDAQFKDIATMQDVLLKQITALSMSLKNTHHLVVALAQDVTRVERLASVTHNDVTVGLTSLRDTLTRVIREEVTALFSTYDESLAEKIKDVKVHMNHVNNMIVKQQAQADQH
jgi:hypothetical protein